MILKDHDWVGSTTAFFKESMRREAMIGVMIPFAPVDMGCRQRLGTQRPYQLQRKETDIEGKTWISS